MMFSRIVCASDSSEMSRSVLVREDDPARAIVAHAVSAIGGLPTWDDAYDGRERIGTQASCDELLRRVRGEYDEMPGLALTMPQARRLWALDQQTCEFVLRTLVERQFLKTTARGRYVRTEQARPVHRRLRGDDEGGRRRAMRRALVVGGATSWFVHAHHPQVRQARARLWTWAWSSSSTSAADVDSSADRSVTSGERHAISLADAPDLERWPVSSAERRISARRSSGNAALREDP
jgi:hypothetical protein